MTMLLLWILAAFGLAYVCGHAFITRSFREWVFEKPALRWFIMLLECPACFGYWIGTLTGPWAFHRAGVPLDWWEATIIGSFAICATNYLLARWTGLIPPLGEAWPEPTALEELRDPKADLGICDARQPPIHHGPHWRLESCVHWRQVQQVNAQEASR